jgi:hypothetical protein
LTVPADREVVERARYSPSCSQRIATEVFEDVTARERQESLPEVAEVMTMLPDCVAAPPEATVSHVSSSEAAM